MINRMPTPYPAVILFAVLLQVASAAPPENVLESAPARIEQYRKGDVQLSLLGEDGKPLAGVTVRVRQVRHAFLFGSSVFPLVYELQKGNLTLPFKEGEPLQQFSRRYAELFNFATLPYYWWGYEKQRGQPVHESRQRIAAWCKERNITTKGHPLVWNYSQLPWLPDDLAEVERLQLAHVGNCVERFRGKVDVWDVVNETTNFAQAPNKARAPTVTAMWEKVGRIELPRKAFRTAREANPNATLLINDFHVGDDFAEVVRGLVDENGKPLYDVIGLQSHMHGGNWSSTKLWDVCERFAPFNKPVHFTELTMLSGKKGWHRPAPWPSTPQGEAEQAREVERVYTLLFSHPAVEAITWWNLSDAHAWMQAPAGLLGKDMSPKPAYNVLKKLIKEEWWTETSLTTDADGKATFRGFHGEYELMITTPDGGQKRIKNLEIRKSLQQKTTNWTVDCCLETDIAKRDTNRIRKSNQKASGTWTFVSMPDFLNVDTTYPQPGWEDTLDYVLKAVKAENPDFVLVAGDLVMGRWSSEEKIEKYAAIYYPDWIKRMNAHGLKFYTAIGDHELGDNPWPTARAKLVPSFKRVFRNHMKMPLNGPAHMKGTAFYFLHKNTLFVSVDVFEKGKGRQGDIVAQVTGKQLQWLEDTFAGHGDVDHLIVMGHTPILGPVRKRSSSGLMLEKADQSPFWKSMVQHNVDLYLCGEVHAITCTERDGVQQIAHGGLFGYNPKVNYLVVKVSPQKIELELKELDIVCKGPKLWQEGANRPHESVTVSEDIRKRGYVGVGRMTIDRIDGKKNTRDKTGYFDEQNNPRK